MSSNGQYCPVCGKKYRFLDKISQPSMCSACYKSKNKSTKIYESPTDRTNKIKVRTVSSLLIILSLAAPVFLIMGVVPEFFPIRIIILLLIIVFIIGLVGLINGDNIEFCDFIETVCAFFCIFNFWATGLVIAVEEISNKWLILTIGLFFVFGMTIVVMEGEKGRL